MRSIDSCVPSTPSAAAAWRLGRYQALRSDGFWDHAADSLVERQHILVDAQKLRQEEAADGHASRDVGLEHVRELLDGFHEASYISPRTICKKAEDFGTFRILAISRGTTLFDLWTALQIEFYFDPDSSPPEKH